MTRTPRIGLPIAVVISRIPSFPSSGLGTPIPEALLRWRNEMASIPASHAKQSFADMGGPKQELGSQESLRRRYDSYWAVQLADKCWAEICSSTGRETEGMYDAPHGSNQRQTITHCTIDAVACTIPKAFGIDAGPCGNALMDSLGLTSASTPKYTAKKCCETRDQCWARVDDTTSIFVVVHVDAKVRFASKDAEPAAKVTTRILPSWPWAVYDKANIPLAVLEFCAGKGIGRNRDEADRH